MSDILGSKSWTLPTGELDGTLAIGWSFVLLAYFLHPAIESAYHRVRAYRAWRAIEKRQAVEVTTYPLLVEVMGGRLGGRKGWDAARIITILLAAFSLASWGLELSMDLGHVEGMSDLLNRPPPVYLRKVEDSITWEVTSPEELGYDENWLALDNVFGGYANSRYYVDTKRGSKFVDGNVRVASWSDSVDDDDGLHYHVEGYTTEVEALECDDEKDTGLLHVAGDSTPWGNYTECTSGPQLTSDLREGPGKNTTSPPMILLTRSGGDDTYIIVEESGNYPSFLYSVWKTESDAEDPVELTHVFHIASTMRLAEAVVTGIVHGEEDGGGCFGWLRKFSENREEYDSTRERASPFGEHPSGDDIELQEVENIEAGVNIDMTALLCFVWLAVLTLIGSAWSLCLRSSIGMDVYNRDELIRAVSLQGAVADGSPPSAIRIFVRKEDAGNMSVVISDNGDEPNWCARLFGRGKKVVERDAPTPIANTVAQYNSNFGGAPVPVGPRTVWLGGVSLRGGLGRALPGPGGNFQYPTTVALSASPVPSNAGSVAGTPVLCPSPPGFVPRYPMMAGGRGASVMFESTYSSSDDSGPEDGGDTPAEVEAACKEEGASTTGGEGGSISVGGWPCRPIEGPDVARGGESEDESQVGSGETTPRAREGSSPLPLRGLTFAPTLKLPRLGRFLRDSGSETKEDRPPGCDGDEEKHLSGADDAV